MLTLAIILLLMSNAVTIRRDKSILFARSSLAILAFCFVLYFNGFHLMLNEKGLNLFPGISRIVAITHIFHIFYLPACIIIMQLSGLFSKHLDLNKNFVTAVTLRDKLILYAFFCCLFSAPARETLILYLSIFDMPLLTIPIQALASVALFTIFYSLLNSLCVEECITNDNLVFRHFFFSIVLLSILYVYNITTKDYLALASISALTINGVGVSYCTDCCDDINNYRNAFPINFDPVNVTANGYWVGDHWSPNFPKYAGVPSWEKGKWNKLLLHMAQVHYERLSIEDPSGGLGKARIERYQWTESSYRYLWEFKKEHFRYKNSFYITPTVIQKLQEKSTW